MLLKTFVEEAVKTLETLGTPLNDLIKKELEEFKTDPESLFQTKVEEDPVMLILSQAFMMLKYPRLNATFTYLIALVKGKDKELTVLKENLRREMQK